MRVGQVCNVLHGLKPTLLMVLVQITFAGVNVFYKLAANNGMSLKIIVAYRYVFATAFMVPMALFFERKNRPKLTKMVLFQSFLCGLFGGSLAQNLYLGSMVLTSATFTCAMANLGPAVTFIMAITFGLERLGLRSHAGQAKVAGTIVGIGGAMLLTFYKGPEVDMWSTHVDLLKHGSQMASSQSHRGSHALGSLFAISSCLSYALWLIIQAKMSEIYPCPYSSTALMSLMGSIQSIIFAICTERNWDQWKLGWDIRLLTVAYTGIAASGLMVTLISWCVRMRGPLFVSVFSPLMLVMVAIAASLLLNETLHLGSIIGGALIVGGLYVVLWGKGKELKKMNQLTPLNCSSSEAKVQIVITSPARNRSSIDNTNMVQLADEVLQQHKNEIVSIENDDSDNKGQDDIVIVSTENHDSETKSQDEVVTAPV